jgi:GAF domain-containing protein
VPGDRRRRILARLRAESAAPPRSERLCTVAADVTGSTGAGVMLMSGDLPLGSPCSSNEVSALLEQLQFELGEGPCVDAYRDDQPVLEPDLATPALPRWLAFTDSAVGAGARAVFGFPLRVGSVRLGALNLYNDTPGSMTDEHHAEALAMADVVALSVLSMQAAAPEGQLASGLEHAGDHQYVVHQASGMVAAQLEVSVAQALMRVRAHAYANERPLNETAAAIVARRLRFDIATGEAMEVDGSG